MISHLAPLSLSLSLATAAALRVETHVNSGMSLDMVSSLIIGSEAAVLVDLPMAIPQAKTLADWVRATTDKPLVAVFTTHSHPDHYLSGAEVLSQFPEAKYYANPNAAAQIGIEAPVKANAIGGAFGVENISQEPAVPKPYDFTFFTLPGDEESPIHLLSPLTGDTVHETLFWVPSAGHTLIAGDSVYGSDMHLWLADLLTPELTESWLATLDLVESLHPSLVVPGHSLSNAHFGPASDVKHTREYLRFWQSIEKKGLDFYTPEEIVSAFEQAFPNAPAGNNTASQFLLNATGQEFGRGGTRQQLMLDLASFNNTAELDGWKFGAASTGCH